jgi:hypothetical protein
VHRTGDRASGRKAHPVGRHPQTRTPRFSAGTLSSTKSSQPSPNATPVPRRVTQVCDLPPPPNHHSECEYRPFLPPRVGTCIALPMGRFFLCFHLTKIGTGGTSAPVPSSWRPIMLRGPVGFVGDSPLVVSQEPDTELRLRWLVVLGRGRNAGLTSRCRRRSRPSVYGAIYFDSNAGSDVN